MSVSPNLMRALRLPRATLLLVAAHLGLLAIFDLADRPVATLVCLLLAFIGLVLVDRSFGQKRKPSALSILLVASLLRLLLLPLPPSLSNDILRYEWDGRVASAGFNPYQLAPDAPELDYLRDDLWEEMHHRTIPTVYPPLALSMFAVATRTPFPQVTIKSLLCVFDLVTCWLLVVLAKRLRLPVAHTIWYCWNPLATLEVAGMGHIDALAVAATVTAVVCLMDRSPRLIPAGIAAAAGVLTKLVPLTCLGVWSMSSRRPWLFGGLVVGLVLLVTAPVFVATGGMPPGLMTYGISWDFNGPLFEPIWRTLDFFQLSPLIADALDTFRSRVFDLPLLRRLYPLLYPQFIAKALLGFVLLCLVVTVSRRADAVSGTARVLGWSLLCSATVYPWYLLWVLPWAALLRYPPWLLMSGLLLLSYLPAILSIPLWPWVYLAIWIPFLLSHLWYPKWSIN